MAVTLPIFFFIFILLILVLLCFIIQTLQKNNEILQANNHILEQIVHNLTEKVDLIEKNVSLPQNQSNDFSMVSFCLIAGIGLILIGGVFYLIFSPSGNSVDTTQTIKHLFDDQTDTIVKHLDVGHKGVSEAIFDQGLKSTSNQVQIMEGVTQILYKTTQEVAEKSIDSALDNSHSIQCGIEAMNYFNNF
jgi:preprotein translocase subunit Sss1